MKDSIAKGVSNLTLILYASGSGTIGINSAIFGGWVLFYYNQVLGLSAVLASTALGISLIFDAFPKQIYDAFPKLYFHGFVVVVFFSDDFWHAFRSLGVCIF